MTPPCGQSVRDTTSQVEPGTQDKPTIMEVAVNIIKSGTAWAIVLMMAAVIMVLCVTSSHHSGPAVGTYPHCTYGVAHAQGSPPQCSMPMPVYGGQ